MGILSKKTIKCEKCGKEYQARITFGIHLCDECFEKEEAEEKRRASEIEAKKEEVRGYVDYAKKIDREPYSLEQLEQIVLHRNEVLEKYRQTSGISRAELRAAAENYKTLTDDEAREILIRARSSSLPYSLGASYAQGCFIPSRFSKIVIDAEDVFAIGFTSEGRYADGKNEVIISVLFTNDPYLPAFPILFVGKLGLLEVFKSKSGRESVATILESMCHNLTYEPQDIKALKKKIKAEKAVKGNIELKEMLNIISDAESMRGIFNSLKIDEYYDEDTLAMLDSFGFIPEYEIKSILKMGGLLNPYWDKQASKFGISMDKDFLD